MKTALDLYVTFLKRVSWNPTVRLLLGVRQSHGSLHGEVDWVEHVR